MAGALIMGDEQNMGKRNKIDVLVIDDDPVFASIIRGYLDGPVYRVSVTSDGKKALEICSKNQFGAIIADVVMPGITGLEFVRMLRGLSDDFTTTPIIFLSANVKDTDLHLGREAGGDEYLKKPVSKKILLSVLSHRIERADQIVKAAEAKLYKFYQKISCRTFSSTCCPRCFFYAQHQGAASQGTCPEMRPGG